MHGSTCLDPIGEENGQVGLPISPIRGLGPGPATAGYMQGPRLSLQNQKHLGGRAGAESSTWRGPVVPS